MTITLPEWTDERHQYLFAGVELYAYKEGGSWFVKTGRCNMCGKCCEKMTPTEHFPVDENGTCKFLVPDGENRVCGLHLSRPFSCSISPGRGRVHVSDDDCTECFEVVE